VKGRAGNINEGPSFDQIELDTLRPAAITGVTAVPGHNAIALSWDLPTGKASPVVSTTIRRLAWGDYPSYTEPGPGYPVGPSEGDLVAIVPYPGTTFVDTIATRDIYFYTAFARDSAANYSHADMTAQAAAISYHLGDFGPAHDGYVDFEDLVVFSDCYGSSPPLNLECDIGPTSTGGVTAIPVPDDSVNFDDLMIFSMNFESVSPAKQAFGRWLDLAAGAGSASTGLVLNRAGVDAPSAGSIQRKAQGNAASAALVAEVECGYDGNRVRATVEIGGNDGSLKGISIDLAFDPTAVSPLSTGAGEILYKADHPYFIHDTRFDGRIAIDAAVLGSGRVITGDGAVVEVVFERSSDREPSIRITAVDARTVDNEPIPVRAQRARLGIHDISVAKLTVYQNYPNPFSRETLIPFALPADHDAAVEIYNAAGQLVATVDDGAFSRGSNIAVWDGADSQGRPVASGLYFYKVRGGKETVKRRMLLLR
jgi:hypothetical protein